MIIKMYFKGAATTLLFAGLSAASAAVEPDPLFAADDVLEVRLAAPFEEIMKERPDEIEIPGILALAAADGRMLELDVGVRTRGNFRRRKDICIFPPLRLNFKKSQLKDTVFAKQDKLKLVTHCDKGTRDYEQAILREYLAYRILNVLTDFSYRVRLLHISYVSTDDRDAEKVSYAFLIENDDRLAKRIELQQQKISRIGFAALQPEYTNLTSVFQFFIGNLDFSPIRGNDGEDCCHNHALFSADQKVYWSIPYDFDLSGIVDAPHAAPNIKLGQQQVRQRVYRGRCVNNDKLPATLQQFRDKRADIEALVDGFAALDKGSRRSIDAYIASFYKYINGKRALEQFAKSCI